MDCKCRLADLRKTTDTFQQKPPHLAQQLLRRRGRVHAQALLEELDRLLLVASLRRYAVAQADQRAEGAIADRGEHVSIAKCRTS